MFIYNWFYDLLYFFGLLHKDARIVFLGLDNAGKTTLLHVLKDDRLVQHVPTLHPHSEELIIDGIRMRTFDLGGHETARRIWKDYFASVNAIVFMVDSSDNKRFHESREELMHLLNSPELSNVPFAVLGNKIDLPHAASEDELKLQLGLNTIIAPPGGNARSRPVELFMCSVIKRMGYAKAFRFIAEKIK